MLPLEEVTLSRKNIHDKTYLILSTQQTYATRGGRSTKSPLVQTYQHWYRIIQNRFRELGEKKKTASI